MGILSVIPITAVLLQLLLLQLPDAPCLCSSLLSDLQILAEVDQEEADVADTNNGAGENLVMSRRHVWRELMQRRAHTCVETLAKLRVDLSERTHAASAPPVATASDEPHTASAKASHSGLYEAIKLEQWMKEDRREREAKAEAEVKALDDEITAVRMKKRRIEYETKVAKVRSLCIR